MTFATRYQTNTLHAFRPTYTNSVTSYYTDIHVCDFIWVEWNQPIWFPQDSIVAKSVTITADSQWNSIASSRDVLANHKRLYSHMTSLWKIAELIGRRPENEFVWLWRNMHWFHTSSGSDRSYSDRITTLLELDRCCLNVLGNVGFGINSVCTAVNISFPNVRLYGVNTADAMAGIKQCHY